MIHRNKTSLAQDHKFARKDQLGRVRRYIVKIGKNYLFGPKKGLIWIYHCSVLNFPYLPAFVFRVEKGKLGVPLFGVATVFFEGYNNRCFWWTIIGPQPWPQILAHISRIS